MSVDDNLLTQLTERERDVLRGIRDGLSNADIGERLVLSVKTVKWYTRQVYSKLGLDEVENKRQRAADIAWEQSLDSPTATAHHASDETTYFIGRNQDRAQLRTLLRHPHHRLITIFGIGGSGKTRLAQQIALDVADDFAGGVHFLMLQSVEDEIGLLAAMARTLQFSLPANDPSPLNIARHLGEQPTLFILDNFEHLHRLASVLVDLLDAAPPLHILLTSRRRLNLSRETVYTLGGLAYPHQLTAKNSRTYAGVQYFVLVAQSINTHWQPTKDDLQHIVEICQLVDGLPLAINLAARWTLLRPLPILVEMLRQDMALLQTDVLDIPERQRSIVHMLDSMYKDLDSPLQRVLNSLSLFVRDFSLEAAVAVGATTPAICQQLLHNGFIDAPEPGTFRLHPLIRRYAEERLAESAEAAPTKKRYIDFYVGVVCTLEPRLTREIAALDSFERDWHNIYRAWHLTLQTDDVEALAVLLVPVHIFTWRRCYIYEGLVLFEAALDYLQANDSDRDFIAHLWVRTRHTRVSTEPLTAAVIAQTEQRCQQLRDAQMPAAYAFSLNLQSMQYRDFGSLDESIACAQEAVEIYERLGDKQGLATSHYQLGLAIYQRGDWETGLQHWQQSLHINADLNDFIIEGMVNHRMAGALWRKGQHRQAEVLLKKTLDIAYDSGDRDMVGGAALLLSLVYFSEGNFAQAALNRDISLQFYRWINNEWQVHYLQTQAVYEALLQGDLTRAVARLQPFLPYALTEQAPILLTCIDHVNLAQAQTLVTIETIRERLPQLHRMQAHMTADIAVALLLPRFVADEQHTRAVQVAAALHRSPTSPAWLLELPAIAACLALTRQHLSDAAYQEAWSRGDASTLADFMRLPLV